MDLKSKVFLKNPRENAGPKTSNRYDFQKDWAICKLIELHQTGKDYLLCFEFHDDIIVFDSADDPKKVNCYQVKTKDTPHWSLSKLTYRDNGVKPSILAKLHQHFEEYHDEVESLNFVTNSKIKGKLTNNFDCINLGEFTLVDLCVKDLKALTDKLSLELDSKDLVRFSELTVMIMGELDLKHHSQITKSRLATFIEDTMPTIKYQIGPFYRTIFDEVKNKTDVEEQAVDFERLKKIKSISRNDFAMFLSVLNQETSMKDRATAIEHRLNAESVDFRFVTAFRNKSKLYEIGKMNSADKNLTRLIKHIQEIITSKPSSASKLSEQMEEIFYHVSTDSIVFEESYIKTVILFELYGEG